MTEEILLKLNKYVKNETYIQYSCSWVHTHLGKWRNNYKCWSMSPGYVTKLLSTNLKTVFIVHGGRVDARRWKKTSMFHLHLLMPV